MTTNTITGVSSPLWLRLHVSFQFRDDFFVGQSFLVSIGLLGKMIIKLGCLTECRDRSISRFDVLTCISHIGGEASTAAHAEAALMFVSYD